MNETNMLNGENTTVHCKPFAQKLDKQIDDFERKDDNDGIHHDIKLLAQWTVRDILALATEINSKCH